MTTELYLGDESKLRMPRRYNQLPARARRSAPVGAPAPVIGDGEEFREVPLGEIAGQSPMQVRAGFDPEGDAEDQALVESLKSDGQRLPVLLVEGPSDSVGHYVPLDGHRRIAALRHIGHPTVKAVIVRAGTLDCDLISLTANVRKNLTPIELAHAVQRLENNHKLEPDDIARRVGMARSYIWSLRRLTKAPAVLAAVEENRIPAYVAFAVLKAPQEQQQRALELADTCELSEPQVAKLLAESKKHDISLDDAAARLNLVRWPVEAARPPVPDGVSVASDAKQLNKGPDAGPTTQPEMTRDDIMSFVKEICPEVAVEQAGDVADLALDHAQPRKIVKAACLLVLSNWEPVKAVEGAELSAHDPLVRRVVAMLDLCLELEGMVREGNQSRECAPMLVGLMKRLVATKRMALQLEKE
ncbi:MAG: ParB/RepB/Spo0J family partition protein [Anaerolineales bacterium]|nr:ParB/RepB/Spo0J family partition protein [Anaerolineales bacterium]